MVTRHGRSLILRYQLRSYSSPALLPENMSWNELHETPGGFSPRWVRYTSLAITILTLVGTFWYSVGIDKNMELKHRTNITTTTQAPDKVGSTTTQSVSIDN